MTAFDEQRKVSMTSIIVRRVWADGTWKHTQVFPDGRVITPNGHLRGLATNRTADANMPQLFNVRYYEDNNKGAESWISPEIQDLLKLTVLRPDGSKESSLEALDVSRP